MNNRCTVNKTLEHIAKKWSLIIILELYKGGKCLRFTELKRKIPSITSKILSARLEELRSNKLITKRIDTTVIPIKCEYSLTRRGLELVEIIKSVKTWGLKWEGINQTCRKTDCKNCSF